VKRSVWIWLAVVFAVSYLLDLVLYLEGGLSSRLMAPILIARMWVPGAAALFWARREGAKLGGTKPSAKLVLLSLGLPLAVTGLWFVGSLLAGAHFGLPPSLVPAAARGQTESQLSLAADHPMAAILIGAPLLVLGSLGSSLATIGEELGWRGLLQPELEAKFSVPRATVVTGLIWGFWHAPVILMGYNFPKQPVFGAVALMPAFCVCLAFPLAYLRRNGGSIWPCAFLHGGVNTMTSAAVTFLAGEGVPASLALLWLGVAVLFAVKLDRAYRESATSRQTSTGAPSSLPPAP
jgi:membrane protease YdiL (CAAX protease family)